MYPDLYYPGLVFENREVRKQIGPEIKKYTMIPSF